MSKIYHNIINMLLNDEEIIERFIFNNFDNCLNSVRQINTVIFNKNNKNGWILDNIDFTNRNSFVKKVFESLNIKKENYELALEKFQTGEFQKLNAIQFFTDNLDYLSNINERDMIDDLFNQSTMLNQVIPKLFDEKNKRNHSYYDIRRFVLLTDDGETQTYNLSDYFKTELLLLAKHLTLMITLPHLSNRYSVDEYKDLGLIAHYESIDKLNRKIPVETPIKLGKYLNNHFNLVKDDKIIRRCTNIHKIEFDTLQLKFVENHDVENWKKLYNKISSCMTDNESIICYCTSSDIWNLPDNGLRLAYIGSLENPEARAIVNQNAAEPCFYKVYGDSSLKQLLINNGYKSNSNFLNNVFIAVNWDGNYYHMPYIDGNSYFANLDDSNGTFILTNDSYAKYKVNYAEQVFDTHNGFECQCCNELFHFDETDCATICRFKDNQFVSTGQHICSDCHTNEYFLYNNDLIIVNDRYQQVTCIRDNHIEQHLIYVEDPYEPAYYIDNQETLDIYNIGYSSLTNRALYKSGDDITQINNHFIENDFLIFDNDKIGICDFENFVEIIDDLCIDGWENLIDFDNQDIDVEEKLEILYEKLNHIVFGEGRKLNHLNSCKI